MVIAFHLTIISPKTSNFTRRRCRGEAGQLLASLSRPAVEVFGTGAKHPQGEPADRQQEEEGDGGMGGRREGGLVSIQTLILMGTSLLSGSRSLHLLSTLNSVNALLLIYSAIAGIS